MAVPTLPVMMHVNQYDGLTIAVSEAEYINAHRAPHCC